MSNTPKGSYALGENHYSKREAKHTPGPWHAGSTTNPTAIGPITDNMGTGTALLPVCHIADRTEKHANARLIAAAPDLLEALKSVLESVPFAAYRGDGELEEVEQKVKRAIAKAEGGK
jgi:hypothetical protein